MIPYLSCITRNIICGERRRRTIQSAQGAMCSRGMNLLERGIHNEPRLRKYPFTTGTTPSLDNNKLPCYGLNSEPMWSCCSRDVGASSNRTFVIVSSSSSYLLLPYEKPAPAQPRVCACPWRCVPPGSDDFASQAKALEVLRCGALMTRWLPRNGVLTCRLLSCLSRDCILQTVAATHCIGDVD